MLAPLIYHSIVVCFRVQETKRKQRNKGWNEQWKSGQSIAFAVVK